MSEYSSIGIFTNDALRDEKTNDLFKDLISTGGFLYADIYNDDSTENEIVARAEAASNKYDICDYIKLYLYAITNSGKEITIKTYNETSSNLEYFEEIMTKIFKEDKNSIYYDGKRTYLKRFKKKWLSPEECRNIKRSTIIEFAIAIGFTAQMTNHIIQLFLGQSKLDVKNADEAVAYYALEKSLYFDRYTEVKAKAVKKTKEIYKNDPQRVINILNEGQHTRDMRDSFSETIRNVYDDDEFVKKLSEMPISCYSRYLDEDLQNGRNPFENLSESDCAQKYRKIMDIINDEQPDNKDDETRTNTIREKEMKIRKILPGYSSKYRTAHFEYIHLYESIKKRSHEILAKNKSAEGSVLTVLFNYNNTSNGPFSHLNPLIVNKRNEIIPCWFKNHMKSLSDRNFASILAAETEVLADDIVLLMLWQLTNERFVEGCQSDYSKAEKERLFEAFKERTNSQLRLCGMSAMQQKNPFHFFAMTSCIDERPLYTFIGIINSFVGEEMLEELYS